MKNIENVYHHRGTVGLSEKGLVLSLMYKQQNVKRKELKKYSNKCIGHFV